MGRMQFDLPGSADIAAHSFRSLRSQINSQAPGIRQVEFEDGETAYFGAWNHYGGSILVSRPLSEEQSAGLESDALKLRQESGEDAKKSHDFRSLTVAPPSSRRYSATWGTRSYGALLSFGNQSLMWESSDGPEGSARTLKSLDTTVIPRPTFSVPSGTGVCLPFAFVGDDGSTWRIIHSSYRLNSHPDIQITLKDATAARTEAGVRTRNAEPEPAMVSIWSQHLTKFKELKPLWSPSTRSVKLAGYSGLASFMQLKREDGSIDYGYLAIVRGDPDAKEDRPDLMLYMIRNADRARVKGKEPVGKEAFIEMAEAIAASVKRRPVR